MRVIDDPENLRLDGVVLTIGNFDGVHRGHQAILADARKRAAELGAEMVVMTFDPHPATILSPDRVPPTLTPHAEKLRLIAQAGADTVVVVPARREFFDIPADQFIREILVARFRPQAVVEGASFRYGAHRGGTPESLRQAGKEYGFEVRIVEPVRVALGGHPDAVISSSLVRHLLSSGTVDQAAGCLGRPYALIGRVEHGAGRGGKLGFPTLNVGDCAQLIPAPGVYAGQAEIPAGLFTAAISVGVNPTFAGDRVSVEAHLPDFSGDAYGQPVRLAFMNWLRPQICFESPAALKDQIAQDVASARRAVQPYS